MQIRNEKHKYIFKTKEIQIKSIKHNKFEQKNERIPIN